MLTDQGVHVELIQEIKRNVAGQGNRGLGNGPVVVLHKSEYTDQLV